MSDRRIIVHRRIMVGALVVAVATLPFSVKLCHGAIIVLIVNWLSEGCWRSKLAAIRQSIFLQLIILLFVLQVVGLAFSDDILRGWFSVEKRIFFLLLPLAFATSLVKLERRDITIIFSTFIFSCLAGTLVCVFAALQEALSPSGTNPSYFALPGHQPPLWLVFSYVGLADGIGMHPTYFSLYLAVCLLLVLDRMPFMKSYHLKFAAMLLILYLIVFIVLLSSRTVIASVCIILLFLLIRSVIQRRLSLSLMAIGASAIFVTMLLVNPVARYRSFEELNSLSFDIQPGMHYTTATDIRISLWWLAANALKTSNPLVGYGTGDVDKAMASTGASFGITNIIHSFDPHNQYMHTWLANGVPALIILFACLVLPAWWSWTNGDFLTCGFVFLFCLVCTTESALELQKGIAFHALMTGLLFFHRNSFQNISANFRSLLRVGEQRL